MNINIQDIESDVRRYTADHAKMKKHFFENLHPALKELPRDYVNYIYDLGYSHGHQNGFSVGLEKGSRHN